MRGCSTLLCFTRTGRRRDRPGRVAPLSSPLPAAGRPGPAVIHGLRIAPALSPAKRHHPTRSDSEGITAPMTNTTKTESPSTTVASVALRCPSQLARWCWHGKEVVDAAGCLRRYVHAAAGRHDRRRRHPPYPARACTPASARSSGSLMPTPSRWLRCCSPLVSWPTGTAGGGCLL